MYDDAGMREVFRGELSAVELAAGILAEADIEFQRRWEQAGGASFMIGETALVPGRVAVLLVPSVALVEARLALASFAEAEPDYLTDLSADLEASRRKRRLVARVVAIAMLAPLGLWLVGMLIAGIYAIFN